MKSCPMCKKSKEVVVDKIPVKQINGETGTMRAYLCEWCSTIFILERDAKEYIPLKK